MGFDMKTDGMAEISKALSQMDEQAPRVAAQGLYKGAGIMAEEIGRGAQSIRTAPFQYVQEGKTRLPSPEEKEIVVDAGRVGIAKFESNGTEINTSVGYRNAGYAELNGKVKPVPVIVNAINSGTSFMQKQPFVRKSVNSGSKKAMAAMKEVIEAELNAMNK